MQLVKNFFHVNLNVEKWDEMIEFYRDKCGFEQMFVLTKLDADRQFGWPETDGDETIPWITYLRVCPEVYLELMDVSVFGRELKYDIQTSPFSHFALTVDNLEETAKAMAKEGVYLKKFPFDKEPLSLEPFDCHHGEDGCLIAWMTDPEGNNIEVMQQTGDTAQERFERENPIAR